MRRRLLNFLTALSLLLFAAACVLWARSMRVSDEWEWVRFDHVAFWDRPNFDYDRAFRVRSRTGRMAVWWERHAEGPAPYNDLDYLFAFACNATSPGPGWRFRWHRWPTTYWPPEHNERTPWTRFGWWRGVKKVWHGERRAHAGFAFPLWLPPLPLAVLPAARGAAAWRRRRLRASGHCPRCGYDLRATPGRCPECGTEPRPVPSH